MGFHHLARKSVHEGFHRIELELSTRMLAANDGLQQLAYGVLGEKMVTNRFVIHPLGKGRSYWCGALTTDPSTKSSCVSNVQFLYAS